MNLLQDWDKGEDEDAYAVYDVLYDIAQKWARMEEFSRNKRAVSRLKSPARYILITEEIIP